MDRDTAMTAILGAIDDWREKHSGRIKSARGLADAILHAIGLGDVYDHNGWTVRRLVGHDIAGTPRGSKHRHGFVATKPDRQEQVAPPAAGSDVPFDYFLRTLDSVDAIYAKLSAATDPAPSRGT